MDETERPENKTPEVTAEPAVETGAEAPAAKAVGAASPASESEHVAPAVSPAKKVEAAPVAEVAEEAPKVAASAALTPALSRREREKAPRRVSIWERAREPEEVVVEMPARKVRARSRRDFLLLGAGTLLAAGGLWWLLPDDTKQKHLTPRLRDWLDSVEGRLGASPERRENLLNRALTFDDDVAEALYSPNRTVRTYSRSQVTPLRNNYNGMIPDPSYIPKWTLTVSGLASGRSERLTIADLLSRFARRDQVTRLCCVEGWSAVAWWGGVGFADFLKAYPPRPDARWARLDSAVGLDGNGNPDPYYVSIDLPTARHPQTLLATHLSGKPLTVGHGAPLRLLAPMKLGLKNIKAITAITYSAEEPADYWNERGYSKYDGL